MEFYYKVDEIYYKTLIYTMLHLEEKLKLIRDLCEKHDITAYEIGSNTPLNTSGVYKIINGETNSPRSSTVNTILNYIENRITGTKKEQIKEEEFEYKTKEPTNSDLLKSIDRLTDLVSSSNQTFSKAIKMTLLNTEEIMLQQNNTQEILKKGYDSVSKLEDVINRIEEGRS